MCIGSADGKVTTVRSAAMAGHSLTDTHLPIVGFGDGKITFGIYACSVRGLELPCRIQPYGDDGMSMEGS